MSAAAQSIEHSEGADLLASFEAACDRLRVGKGTRADVEAIAKIMRARGHERIRLVLYRASPYMPKSGIVKMLGHGGGPPSRADSKLERVDKKLIAGWWDLDQLEYWLRTHPASGSEGDRG